MACTTSTSALYQQYMMPVQELNDKKQKENDMSHFNEHALEMAIMELFVQM